MVLAGQWMGHGTRMQWPGHGALASSHPPMLGVVLGGGRGCTLQCAAAPAALWIALHGQLQLALPEGTLSLPARQLLVTEEGQAVHARGRGSALWVAILAPREGWRHLLCGLAGMRASESVLLPARHAAPRALCRLALDLARAVRQGPSLSGHDPVLLGDFAHAVAEQQSTLAPLVDLCPGRTLAHRRAVFVRLQRVRRYMLANSHLDLDTAHLASKANYSLSHFIRSYRRVFGQTPHAALVDDRLERAHAMLGNSALAVGEVALASGFENRCAFSRVFKQRYGVTAQEVRRTIAA